MHTFFFIFFLTKRKFMFNFTVIFRLRGGKLDLGGEIGITVLRTNCIIGDGKKRKSQPAGFYAKS